MYFNTYPLNIVIESTHCIVLYKIIYYYFGQPTKPLTYNKLELFSTFMPYTSITENSKYDCNSC